MSSPAHGRAARALRLRGYGLAWAGGGMLIVLALVAIFAPLLAPHDPRAFDADPLLAPSWAHPMGTNSGGQDLFSQLVYGARDVLVVAPLAALFSVALGAGIGTLSALAGGRTDAFITRVVDVGLALPKLPLLILLAVAAGPSTISLVVSVGLLAWPVTARYVRAQALSLRRREHVLAARSFGGGPVYLARRHLLPALSSILVSGFVSIAALAVLLEAGLAFLGLGDPQRSSWGLTMNDALQYEDLFFGDSWLWWLLPPGAATTLAILGFTLLGVGLEPRLNPRVREHLT